MTYDMWVALILFLLTFAVIVTERIHRTAAALAGGFLVILLGVVDQETAFHSIDLNVILLLAGMMVIAALMAETGVFQSLAVRAVRLGRGSPVRIMVLLALVTAFTSALLDNVTVIVLIAPVMVFIAANLGISPVPFLITSVMASNIGGAATLIGDPPNILIGSAAGIGFIPFLANMAPPSILVLAAYAALIHYQFRKKLPSREAVAERIQFLDSRGLVTNPRLLKQCLFVLALVFTGFLSHSALHLEVATIAMSGATLLLIITRQDPHKIFERVEWSTLMFFVGLFVVVEAVVAVGIIARVGEWLLGITGGNLRLSLHLVLWVSAAGSGIVDNIPYTATMIPLIQSLAASMDIAPLWWALALGADFGGNLTLLGASANVVAANLAERSDHQITFGEFFRYGFWAVLVSLIISSLWLELAYL
jgi:Na+/H+ antiporter NhaD/arsenite permease-like protein